MSKPNHVARISVTMTMHDGEEFTLLADQLTPSGGNPRFIGQQIDSGMADLTHRLSSIADLYGKQIRA